MGKLGIALVDLIRMRAELNMMIGLICLGKLL